MNQQTFHFIGQISTLEPLTVSIAKPLSKGHQIPKNNGIPYFPSSSLIGAIRSAGCKYVIDHLANRNEPVKLDLNSVYSLFQGYVVDNKINDQIQKSKAGVIDSGDSLREANPLLSVFGRWGLAGKLGVGSAYASNENQVKSYEGGFRIDIFERDEELRSSLTDSDLERYFSITGGQSEVAVNVQELKKSKTALTSKLRTADESDKKLIRAEIQEIELKIKQSKEESGEAKETIRRPLDSMEAIVPNTNLSHRMSLKRATEEELGAVLYALAQLSLNPQLGGKSRHNWGRVSGEWDVMIPTANFKNEKVGKVGFNDTGFFVEGDILESAMEKYNEGLQLDKYDFTRII